MVAPLSYRLFDEETQRLFEAANRSQQLVMKDGGTFVVRNVAGDTDLRMYVPVVSFRDDAIAKGVNNLTEMQRSGAASVLMSPDRKVGLVEVYRPVILPAHADVYRELWDRSEGNPVWLTNQIINLIGGVSLEFSQGYSKLFEDAADTAAREAREEGGHFVKSVERMGYVATDPANRLDLVNMFLAHVDPSQPTKETPDPLEAMTGKVSQWVTEHEFLAFAAGGHIFNSLTLSAYTLMKAQGHW